MVCGHHTKPFFRFNNTLAAHLDVVIDALWLCFEQSVWPSQFQLCVTYTFLSLQEVFPIQYGTKFDTALQALTAGLVCKLEQLLPVPNLSQVCTSTVIAF